MKEIIFSNLSGVVFIIIAFLYIRLAKFISDRKAMKKGLDANLSILNSNNMALALRRSGLYFAIGLGMFGAIAGPSRGFWLDTGLLLIDGALVVAFIFIAQAINDKQVLRHMDNTQAIKDKNLAVGYTEFGAYIATGLIAMASFQGEGGGIISSLVFFVFGQVLLVIATKVYEKFTSWNVISEVANGNAGAGMMLGGIMIAISIAIFGAIAGDFNSWATDIPNFLVSAIMAILFLVIASKLIDDLFLTGTSVEEEIAKANNCAAISIAIAIKIVAALMITAALI